ncbi:MAG: cation:proton antiporter [Candidatus Acidiferrales bacterium]
MDTPVLFRDLAVIFAAALLGGLLAWRLRLPLILGFVAGGILISPFTPGPSISDPHSFELFAEIGVVLLMFTVGLEFSIGELLKVKWVALLGAPLGITLSLGVGTLTSELMGWPFKQGLVIGAVISVASTMVMIRLLMDRGDQNSLQGHVMIGITLIEDFAVVIMTVLLPTLGGEGKIHPGQIAWTLGKAFLLLIPVVLITIKGIPPLLAWVAKTKDQELFLLAALTISLGTASLTHAAGLSAAFGAFLAGLVISGSKYTHQTLAQLLPMRNAFVALFFVTVGALIEPQELFSSLGLLATMLVLIIAGKMMVWTLVVRLFGYPFWTAVAVAIGLTQIGEFSFLLVEVARTSGLVGRDVYNATLAASLITILLNAFLMRYAPRWIPKHPSVVPAKAA